MGEVKPDNDNFVFSFIIGGLEPESECIFHVNPIWGDQNQPCTISLSIGGPIYGQPPDREVRRELGVSVGSVKVNSMMKSTKTCPLIAVFGLYLMSNSLSSMAHFTSLPEVYGLCNICFIGCSIEISMV